MNVREIRSFACAVLLAGLATACNSSGTQEASASAAPAPAGSQSPLDACRADYDTCPTAAEFYTQAALAAAQKNDRSAECESVLAAESSQQIYGTKVANRQILMSADGLTRTVRIKCDPKSAALAAQAHASIQQVLAGLH